MAVLIKLGDSVRNSALVHRITQHSIGGLKKTRGLMAEFRLEHNGNAANVLAALIESVGSGRNPDLNPRLTLSNSCGPNRAVGFRAACRLGFMGN